MVEEAFIRLRLSLGLRPASRRGRCGTVGACNHVDKAFVTRVPLVPERKDTNANGGMSDARDIGDLAGGTAVMVVMVVMSEVEKVAVGSVSSQGRAGAKTCHGQEESSKPVEARGATRSDGGALGPRPG